jgi:S-adenosylmethionine hydrolase
LNSASLIVLFTDFGLPYTGQMKAVLRREAPAIDIIDLFNDAPAHDPMAAAYLLPAYVEEFPEETVFLCVVDPGVGGTRVPGVLRAGGRWYVGPDNGLFEMIVRRASDTPRWWEIDWRPELLSSTFHGRDLFAPVAARIARGQSPQGSVRPVEDIRRVDWPDDLAQIIYIDGFGNTITGIRAKSLREIDGILTGDRRIERADTFSDVSPGAAFWYENANGLVEIAVNQGKASTVLGLAVGSEVRVVPAS